MAGVRRGAFTCVRWQVTLCDPIWQVTSRSSEVGFLQEELYRPLPFTFTIYLCDKAIFGSEQLLIRYYAYRKMTAAKVVFVRFLGRPCTNLAGHRQTPVVTCLELNKWLDG